MKVINICNEDHANFSYDNSLALRSVGVECDSYKVVKHPFNYTNESKIVSKWDIRELIEQYDVVQIMHSSVFPFEINKPKVVWHTGTAYRMNAPAYNEVFKGIKPIIALGEFDVLCPGAEYVVGAIDVDRFDPDYSEGNTFGHYPSDALTKGSYYVEMMCEQVGVKLKKSIERVDYSKQLERMKGCDIYIELFALVQNGRPYGSWGITALEAAALGKVVMTCHTTYDVYQRAYGTHPLWLSNNEMEFKNNLRKLKSWDNISELKRETRKWVEQNHSYKATGERVKRILEKL